MALFTMILRRMIKNKWLVFSLFTGMLMTTALVSTMPVYSDAILSRMLVKDLERLQTESGKYPGAYYAKVGLSNGSAAERTRTIDTLDGYMRDTAAPGFSLPVRELVTERTTRSIGMTMDGKGAASKQPAPAVSLKSSSGIEDHVQLIDGRLPADTPVPDGTLEVMVTARTLAKLDAVLGNVLSLDDERTGVHLKVKPVGVYANKEAEDLYFRDPSLSDATNMLIVNEKLFRQVVMDGHKAEIASVSWYFVLDYTKLEIGGIPAFEANDKAIKAKLYAKADPSKVDYSAPALQTLERYSERAGRLGKLMWSLNVPVLIMLGFYMFMVANLTAERQKTEIAVLRSRGASRLQVAAAFALEALILSLAAFAAGPLLALGLTRLLGAANGFLLFVQRASLPGRLGPAAFGYAAAAAAGCFLMALIPVIRATRVSIVAHKQQAFRRQSSPFWHKAFLDVLLLAVAFYGLFTFRSRLDHLKALGLTSEDLNLDPLQFVVPALFILGGGLLLLRLYPLLLRLIYRAGRKWWPPGWYMTLIQVGRAGSGYQFLMVFLIVTLATGVFSAGAARTINNNMEERIRYADGADFVLSSIWPSDAPAAGAAGMPGGGAGQEAATQSVHYTEPPFDPYLKLPGVQHTAKVFVKEDAAYSAGEGSGSAILMGIDTDDFCNTAWFRNSLLPHPLNDYLNLIAPDPRAILVSSSLMEQNKLKTGDTLWLNFGDNSPQPFIVYGAVPYFPTFNPNPSGYAASQAEGAKAAAPMLVIGHLSQIQLQLALEPYQVWLKVDPQTSTAAFYKGIESSGLAVSKVVSTREDLIRTKNDPFLMAVNGILTLGFLISVLVTFAGFLLYWILSLKGRTLQNGIMRAMGLSLRRLIGMLALEQLLTSGMAVLIGMATGNLASRLYVPNFQIAFNPGSLVPPFRVVLAAADFARLYVIVGCTLLLGLGILGVMLSRLRIHQALKLGED